MDKTKLLEQFKKEVQRSLIMTAEDKVYWLEAAAGLDAEVLESIFNLVKGKNELIDGYIKKALENDAGWEYLKELKTKIRDLKKNTLQVEEKNTQPNAEELLESQLKKI